VKGLLWILLGGFVAFMALAMAQEREVFLTSWFAAPEVPVEVAEEDRAATEDAVRLVLSLMRHFYLSGGDPRFAERMPASEGLIEEMHAEIEYLAGNRRIQDPSLEAIEITAVELLGEGRVEVRTRERWHIRVLWAEEGEDAEPPRSQTLDSKYLLIRDSSEWRVEAWQLAAPGAEEGALPG